MAIEREIDAMKYRKSTHLAGVDIEAITDKGERCILTIKDAYYGTGVDVNGKKTDGYFLEFLEDVKPMVVNSTNRKTIASNVKTLKNCSAVDSRNIGNWINVKIELYFEPNRSFGGVKTGGIGVVPQNLIKETDPAPFLAVLNGSKDLKELGTNWTQIGREAQALAPVAALKEQLKAKLK